MNENTYIYSTLFCSGMCPVLVKHKQHLLWSEMEVGAGLEGVAGVPDVTRPFILQRK